VVFGNDIVTHYSYWAPNETYGGVGQGGRLHELKTGTVADPTGVQYLSYAYDKVGNVANTWDMNNPPTSGYQRTDYVYDALDRLTDAGTSGGDYFFSKHCAYSVDGNIETFGTRTLGYDDPDRRCLRALHGGREYDEQLCLRMGRHHSIWALCN